MALRLVRRLGALLRPTQTDPETPGQPRQLGAGGRYEYVPLRFPRLDRVDVAALNAAVRALGDSTAEEAAYQRTVDRFNGIWTLGSGPDRFTYWPAPPTGGAVLTSALPRRSGPAAREREFTLVGDG